MSVLLQPFYSPVFKATDGDGKPLVGGLLYTYAAGTLNPQATYADANGTTPKTNPVVLDANGQAQLYLGSDVYKFVLQDAAGVTQWTVDNVSAVTALDASNISGTISLSNLPDYPLSRIVVDENPAEKFFNQQTQSAGSDVTQRSNLNFVAPLVATDNNGTAATDVTLADTAVTPGSYTSANITVDQKGRITAASNAAAFPSRVDDANGSSLTLPDGTIFKWGASVASSTGVPKATIAVTFPGGAFSVPPTVTLTPDRNPDGGNNDPIEAHLTAPATVNGFNVLVTADVLIGGSGASNITNPVRINWDAKGH